MGYYLNPNEMMAMFAVPQSLTDKHLRLATHDQLKVLLWCLKNLDKQYDIVAAAEALKTDEYSVRDALDFWCERGVLCATATETASTASAPLKTEEPEKKKKTVRAATIKPGRDEVARRGVEDPEIAFLLREAEQHFGRVLRQAEASSLVWLYDDVGLNASLILMIVNFAITEGRANITFIERTAIEWANDGITDIIEAEQRLTDMRRKKDAWTLVERTFGIKHRSPSKSELEMSDTWVNEWGYGFDIIREAYEVCINTTSEFSIPYIKKVITEWHKKGVKTVSDIEKLDSAPTKEMPQKRNEKQNKLKQETTANTDNYDDFIKNIIAKNEEKK